MNSAPFKKAILRLQPCPCSAAAGRPDEELLLWRGKRTDLMEQGKAIRHAPVLNQLPVAKAANINHVDCNGLARMWIITCRPRTRPNGIFRLNGGFQRQL